jgi:hypothetical protein
MVLVKNRKCAFTSRTPLDVLVRGLMETLRRDEKSELLEQQLGGFGCSDK